jgi:hypothetical protein
MYPDIDAVVELVSDGTLPGSTDRWSWNPGPVVPCEEYV